eukprot:CAMPEP_0115853070 /NCGR_PEP_ID=MMETSP0287-20121206/13317_1 /TAXON_ID=412157 /ORGANISM="Chrysochromulina rotalis, Strain UIO044" /LENGTH=385 /DNA_ID=CAMNT_0003307141 /DNA_START=18 /DNA_END=1175 /DNA_ORIENTATION=+
MALPESREAVLACERCCRPVGTIADQLRHVVKDDEKVPENSFTLDSLAGKVRCRHGCAALFCSAECEEVAAASHGLLCPARRTTAARVAAARFEEHAMGTYETFLFGARVVTDVHSRALHIAQGCHVCRSHPTPCVECYGSARAPYDEFCRVPWWTISEEGVVKTKSERQEAYRAANKSRQLLLDALPRDVSGKIREWLTVDAWGGLLGASRRNALCVTITHPLDELTDALLATKRHRDARDDGSGDDDDDDEDDDDDGDDNNDDDKEAKEGVHLDGDIDDLLGLVPQPVPDALWTALFPHIARLNHSCRPNMEVHFLGEDSEATLIAKRDIAAGTELSISYIDDNERAGYRDRRASLRDYGFECDCPKCTVEEEWTRRLRPRRH